VGPVCVRGLQQKLVPPYLGRL